MVVKETRIYYHIKKDIGHYCFHFTLLEGAGEAWLGLGNIYLAIPGKTFIDVLID